MPQVTLNATPLGLTLEVLIGISSPRIAALQAEQKALPAPVQTTALIDTGA